MAVEVMTENIYRIEIPLPGNPLKVTNSYLICGGERNLLVDTGFNREECRAAMDEALSSLYISMENTDLFITHLHSDHAGLIGHLATPKTKIYMSKADGQVVAGSQESSHWAMFNQFFHFSGMQASGVENNIMNHPGYRFAAPATNDITMLPDGYQLTVGDYNFRCIITRGHTAGHMCLYDQKKRLLLSGDHILGKITPNITLWYLGTDVLGQYLESLDRIAELDVDLVLPAHRHVIHDCRLRIAELKTHHNNRLHDVLNIVSGHRYHATDVAKRMKWDLSFKEWDDFPWGQKLFATGEAMSHLYHLALKGELVMSSKDDVIYFACK
ncbi:MAG: MBL fold metallo-hydrolase [Methylocystaceae bacterium]